MHILYGILFAGYKTQQKITIYNLHLCDDVVKILSYFAKVGLKMKYFKDKTIFYPMQNFKNFNLNDLSFSRASVCGLSSCYLLDQELELKNVGGCGFDTRPIGGHINILQSFKNNDQKIDCSIKNIPSVGMTIHAILGVFVSGKNMRLQNIALEPAVIQVLELLSQCGLKYNLDDRELEFSRNEEITNKIELKIVSGQPHFVTILGVAVAKKENLIVTNYIPDKVIFPIISRLFRIEKIGTSYKIFTDKFFGNNGDILVADVFPAISTDICPMLSVIYFLNNTQITVEEKVYSKRNAHILELAKLGLKYKIEGNKYTIFPSKLSLIPTKLDCLDIRTGASLYICAIRFPQIILQNIEQINRGYENLFDSGLVHFEIAKPEIKLPFKSSFLPLKENQFRENLDLKNFDGTWSL